MFNLLPSLFRRRAMAALARCCIVFTLLCSLLLPGGSTVGAPVPTANSPVAIESHSLIRSSSAATPAAARVTEALRSGPVMFIENVGQFDEHARFQVRGGIGTMWLADIMLVAVHWGESCLKVHFSFGAGFPGGHIK